MVHLPIGILIFAFLQLSYNKFISSKATVSFNLSFALFVIFLSTVISAVTGYERASSGGFQGDILDLHKYLGFVLCGVAFLLWFCYNRYKKSNVYYAIFFAAILLLCYVGHLGGTLTHGDDFLSFSGESETSIRPISDPLKVNAFTDIILPITNQKCASCHNQNKSNGNLLMLTKTQWLKGGKNGPLIDMLNKDNSLISVRMHLPFKEKEHMPPTGKKQLTVDEFRILDWWVQNMKDFEQNVESMNPTNEIVEAINNLYGEDNLQSYSKDHLATLDKYGIKYHQLDSKYKALAIDFSNTKVTKQNLKVLHPLKQNIKEMDLSFANIDNGALSGLKEFTVLTKLDLDNTGIETSDLKFLKSLSLLESLNLYNTKVDDNIAQTLTSMPKLKQLYLWQTDLTESFFETLKNSKNDIVINSGIKNEFSDAQLLRPNVEVDSYIFSDSMVVSLTALPKNTDIFYSLDSDTVTETSFLYKHPFVIKKSTELIAQSTLEGWKSSELKKETFLKSRIKPESVKLRNKPNEKYYAKGEESLFDLSKGSEIFSDGLWLGFQKKHCYLDLKLREVETLSSVSIGTLLDAASYIFLPRGIRIEVSLDGQNFTEVANIHYAEMQGPGPKQLKNLLFPFDDVKAKYLRIEILSQLKNPLWHPAPSAPSWLFIDEIALD